MSHECHWECGFAYDEEPTTSTEAAHLQKCSVYRNRPVVRIREDGKKFVESLYNPHVLIELVPLVN